MLSISLGPLVIPLSLLIIFVGLFAFWSFTYLQTRKNPQQKAILDAVSRAIIVGFFAARVAFVITMWQSYKANLWQIINISDGGFVAFYGWLSGGVVLLFYARKNKQLIKVYFISAMLAALGMAIPTFSLAIYQTGIELPSAKVHNMQGQEIDLTDYKGQPVVINFWASWCPPCRREMPVLASAQQKYADDVVFIFLNQGESKATVRQFINSEQLALQNMFFDPASRVSRESGSAGLPTTLFYDAQGGLVESHMGELSQASLNYNIQKIR